jgi:hypothetical protein
MTRLEDKIADVEQRQGRFAHLPPPSVKSSSRFGKPPRN